MSRSLSCLLWTYESHVATRVKGWVLLSWILAVQRQRRETKKILCGPVLTRPRIENHYQSRCRRMTMAEAKTKPTAENVTAFLNQVSDKHRRDDCFTVLKIMK